MLDRVITGMGDDLLELLGKGKSLTHSTVLLNSSTIPVLVSLKYVPRAKLSIGAIIASCCMCNLSLPNLIIAPCQTDVKHKVPLAHFCVTARRPRSLLISITKCSKTGQEQNSC